MKRILLIASILALFSYASFSQIVVSNPYVSNGSFVSPVPTIAVGCGPSSTFSFTAGLSTTNDYPLPPSGVPVVMIVSISNSFEFDGQNTVDFISGSYASNFTWSIYSPTSVIAVQNTLLPGIGSNPNAPNPLASGLVNIKLKTKKSVPNGASISALVNLTQGAFSTGNNSGDDAVSASLTTAGVGISGQVFNDTTCTPNGNDDGVVNGPVVANGAPLNNMGGPTTAPSDTLLFVSLVDSLNMVVDVDSIETNGSFEFPRTTPQQNYTVVLSSTKGVLGAVAPNVTMPYGWMPVGESNYDFPNTVETNIDGKLFVPLDTVDVSNNIFGIWAPLQAPLSIFLKEFRLTEDKCYAVLSWDVESENQLEKIEVYRKENSQNDFELITSIIPDNTSQNQESFSYTDKSISNFDNLYQYKLKFIDAENNEFQSAVESIKVNCPGSNEPILIYPNPSSGKFNVFYRTNSSDVFLKLDVLDVSGRKIYSQSQIIFGNETVAMDIRSISKGFYFLRCENVDEGKIYTLPFSLK